MDAWLAAPWPAPEQVPLRQQVLWVLAQHPAGLTPGGDRLPVGPHDLPGPRAPDYGARGARAASDG